MGGIDFAPFIPDVDLLQTLADRLTSGEGDMGVLWAQTNEVSARSSSIAREAIVRIPGPERPRMDENFVSATVTDRSRRRYVGSRSYDCRAERLAQDQ